MEISGNAFVSGLNAVQSGSARVAQAGSEIARNTVEARSAQAEQMVELTRGKLEAQSGARVIEVADETLGTLIDTHACGRPDPSFSDCHPAAPEACRALRHGLY